MAKRTFPAQVAKLEASGRFSAAREHLAELAEKADDAEERGFFQFEAERLTRIEKEFPLTEQQAFEMLRPLVPRITAEDLQRWREAGHIQSMILEGELRYFRRGPRNLLLRCEEAQRRRVEAGLPPKIRREPRAVEPGQRIDLAAHLNEIRRHSGLCCPKRYRVVQALALKALRVPEGATVRCWIPVPREEPHQTDFTLLWTQPDEHVLAPPDAPHRSISMRRTVKSPRVPTHFRVCYEFTAWASHTSVDPAGVEPSDPNDDEFQRFTAEEPPNIVFTPEVRSLAEEIVGGEPNPLLRAKRICSWITANITWIGEMEYSTITDFTGLCLSRRAGDCGVQVILFITLCRAAGVPARWESGWWIEPTTVNMHDWARFLIRPHGWLWADLTKGTEAEDFGDSDPRAFYFGNIDACRLVANAAIGQPLTPPKQHFRSDTVDFQRGEAEWEGGNLNFDAWECDIEVELITRAEEAEDAASQ